MYEIGNIATSPFKLFLTRKVNVWYTVCDGNWNDPNVWISNSLDKRSVTLPQPGDDVYINHIMVFDTGIGITTIVNNLYISGKLTSLSNQAILQVNGDLQATGFIDFSGSVLVTLILNGVNNSIVSSYFNGGTSSMIQYSGSQDQPILDIPYRHLTTTGYIGTKYPAGNLSVAGNFNMQSFFDCKSANITITGTSLIGLVGAGGFKSTGTANLLFIGPVDFESNTDLSGGNPNIEFRGGVTVHTFFFETGTGNISFTTNNQNLNPSAFLGTGKWNAPTTIVGAITVTITAGSLPLNTTINGTVAGSTLNNSGTINYYTYSLLMSTGVFNYKFTTTSGIGYYQNGNFTLPYTSYANLAIDGTGVKKIGANTVVGQSFNINGSTVLSTFDCNGFDLTVTSTFVNNGLFTATSFSNILFAGFTSWTNGPTGGYIDLRTGNPNIEFRGGLSIHANATYTGTGTYTFSTSNQNFDMQVNNGGVWAANILISGAITVTFLGGSQSLGISQTIFTGTLNGDNANSTFVNKGVVGYNNATAPMSTGRLYCNQASNTFIYGLVGNQDITAPADPTFPGYSNLILNGSGAKGLLGNVSVKGTYTLTSPATLNSHGFALTNP
ncbi:MAG TPA: hypothetical protein VGN20_19375 [Mucilaginibacter sp.]|jgi:hypothetical protein